MKAEQIRPYVTDPQTQEILAHSMNGKLKYTLMNDFLSKYSLQKDLYALSGLLAALLHIHPEEITAIEILNPIEPGSVITDRNCILDVNLELNHRKIVNIELQSRRQDYWPERSITYLCRNFDQLREGESYEMIKPCVQIGILEHDLFRMDDPRYTDEFYSEYELLSATNHTAYSSKFSIKVLLLNHLEQATDQDKADPNGLYKWAKLFRAGSWEELKMIADENPRMTSFVGTVRKLSAEEQVAQACEARRRYTQDIATYEHEIQMLESQRDMVSEQRDRAAEERDRITEERDKLLAYNADMQAEIEALKRKLKEMEQ